MGKTELESQQMYLKAIYNIERSKRGAARAIDVASYLGITKASVSGMLKKLQNQEFLTYGNKKPIKLTKKGLSVAKKVTDKYKVLESFLIKVLKVPPAVAYKEACESEHIFSDETIEKMKEMAEKGATD